jgi:tetratricopeptide (TPR) repeat protein
MKSISILVVSVLVFQYSAAQDNPSTIKESTKVFTTYGFSDPNPIPDAGRVYPYFRFDGYTDKPSQKEWKTVELENDYIKVMILPEIGGKIWAAWEKSTGKPFIYYNHVVKFRDVAMRGPWTSGGIEANYGIIGHTPNCATPVDYLTEKKPDGSVSCYIGTLDLLTQTYWTIEINLPRDKGYFTTHSFWSNATPIEQPYYTWMNTGMKASGNLEFIYPGNRYLGHSGEYSDWHINPDNNKDISFYENNDFGGPKSYHVFGKYTNFFGVYYHDEDFGMARYSLRDEKAGKKIWIWGLSRQGMIWEDLLTDSDGQYVEIQSGRLFNQAAEQSNRTPFKQLGFAPYTSDEWTEYWFPVKGTQGFVMANPYGALNLRVAGSNVKIDFLPLQNLNDELKVYDGKHEVYSKTVALKTMKPFSDTFTFAGNADNLTVTLGKTKMRYDNNPNAGVLSRPVDSPQNFDWNSVFGLYTQGKESLQERNYTRAEEKLKATLASDPNYLPALSDMAMLSFRNLQYDQALAYARKSLSIDTYDPAGNFYYGLANARLGKITDAKDGFDIASLSPAWRGAAYTELGKIYAREEDYIKALHYAKRSLQTNGENTAALQLIATIHRMNNERDQAEDALRKLSALTPLNHFVRFEKYRWENSDKAKNEFTSVIRNEMPAETYQQLADWYESLGCLDDAVVALSIAPENPEILYRIAFLKDKQSKGDGKQFIERANAMSPKLVFPFRATSADALSWATQQTGDWKPKYFLALIRWSHNDIDGAKDLFAKCGEPPFAPFYAARATLLDNETSVQDLKRASRLEPKEWRYGKLLAEKMIEEKNYADALTVIGDYHKRFPADFRINMLMAKALLLNGEYKATTDLLNNTTILPYEGATGGHELYREAWLMQAVGQIASRKYKQALESISRAKLWPENLGVGKPYDENIDLRLENYLEALIYEKTKQKDKADQNFRGVADAKTSRRRGGELITALALRKSGRDAEGEKLLLEWKEKEPDNPMASWSYATYYGEQTADVPEENGSLRVIMAMVKAKL